MKEIKNACDIKSCYLCRLCLPDWLPAIGAHKRNFEVKKGQQIITEGQPVTGIYFVYKGTLKVHKRWDAEKELILRFSRPGDIFGYLGLGKESLYPVSATALENSVVCYVGMDFFDTTLNVNSRLTKSMMCLFANELQLSQKNSRNLAHMSVRARIAQSFLQLKNQFGTRENGLLDIDISRQDIASYAGTTYETLFRVVSDWTKVGIIELTGKNIKIKNDQMLCSIVQQENKSSPG